MIDLLDEQLNFANEKYKYESSTFCTANRAERVRTIKLHESNSK